MILLINIPSLGIDMVGDVAVLLFIIYFIFIIHSLLVLVLILKIPCKNCILIFSGPIKN